MFPRLDEHADNIVKKVAQEIAYEMGLDYVGTEHVLLAILRHNQGVGARVLRHYGMDESRARLEIERILARDMEDTWVFGRLPGSPHYRNVVALAIDEATQLEAKEIGTEHILLALLREEGSTAQRVLATAGVTLKACRQEVLRELSDSKRPRR
ncbi:MAG: Clp protease N-terminal domain-containing protein [Phycisphaerae bacterium]